MSAYHDDEFLIKIDVIRKLICHCAATIDWLLWLFHKYTNLQYSKYMLRYHGHGFKCSEKTVIRLAECLHSENTIERFHAISA